MRYIFSTEYYLGNVNHAISVVGYWIFESNYKKSLVLNRESLDMICDPSVGEEEVTEFETVFTSARYICLDACLKKDYLWYMNLTSDSYPIFFGIKNWRSLY